MLPRLNVNFSLLNPHIDTIHLLDLPKTFSAKDHIAFYDRLAFLLETTKDHAHSKSNKTIKQLCRQ